jgi:hypothetical protein
MYLNMFDLVITILLTLLSFIGTTIVYFLKLSFQKLELLSIEINQLKIDIEKLKK